MIIKTRDNSANLNAWQSHQLADTSCCWTPMWGFCQIFIKQFIIWKYGSYSEPLIEYIVHIYFQTQTYLFVPQHFVRIFSHCWKRGSTPVLSTCRLVRWVLESDTKKILIWLATRQHWRYITAMSDILWEWKQC